MKQYIGKKICFREIISAFTDQNVVCCQADLSFTSCEVCEANVEKHGGDSESFDSLYGGMYIALHAPKMQESSGNHIIKNSGVEA